MTRPETELRSSGPLVNILRMRPISLSKDDDNILNLSNEFK